MKEKFILIIPEEILVKSSLSSDTLSGNFGVMNYERTNGSILKENSWNNIKCDAEHRFKNVPTNGFTIYNKIGYWQSEYSPNNIKVSDPRGFDFYISVMNLLDILTYSDIIENKICGSLVHSWDKYGNYHLLPVSSEIYKESSDIMKKRTIDKYTSKDLIPGNKYVFKPGKLSYVRKSKYDKENLGCGIFLGIVKLPKDYSKYYETGCLFYGEKEINNIDRDFVYIMDPKDVDYLYQENALSSKKVSDILSRFRETAFSWEFWNGDTGPINELKIINDDSPTIKSFIFDTGESNKIGLIDKSCSKNEFLYKKSYIEYSKENNGFYSRGYYYKDPKIYISCKFSVINGKLVIDDNSLKPINLGTHEFKLKNLSSRYGKKLINDIYLTASKSDIDEVIKRATTPKKGISGYIVYKTNSGEYSESLQVVLDLVKTTTLGDFPKNVKGTYSDLEIMYLPIKL